LGFAGTESFLDLHGGAHGKRIWVNTPAMFMYPKVLAKTGSVPGGAKRTIKMAVIIGIT
jgi:hypothetical protein